MSDKDNLNLAETYCKQARYILEEFFSKESKQKPSKRQTSPLSLDSNNNNSVKNQRKKNSNADLANVFAEVSELYFKSINTFNKLAEPYLGLAAIFNFCQKPDLAIHFLMVGSVNVPDNKMIKQMLETFTGSTEIKAEAAPNLFNFKLKKSNNLNTEEV
jgi:hypothetical protein